MNQISFEDYYEDLQISPNADQETIERVYRLLAKRYHPDSNGNGSGKTEKFEIITNAYKTLANPEKRAAYDAAHEQARERQWRVDSEQSSSQEYENDRLIRRNILSALYFDRRQSPSDASVGLWRFEKLLGWPEKILEFHTWYLKEKGWIERTESGGFAITALGVDEIENDGFLSTKGRLLTDKAGIADEDEFTAEID